MEKLIKEKYPKYNWSEHFIELPEDINDVIFLMKCRYSYAEYPIKQVEIY